MEKFDFSKPADQEKFEQLPPEEKKAETNRAEDEAADIQKKAEIIRQRRNIGYRRTPSGHDYADATVVIDEVLKPWKEDIDRYDKHRTRMQLRFLTPENNIFLEKREEVDEEFPKDVIADTKDQDSVTLRKKIIQSTEKKRICIETYDISKAIPALTGSDLRSYGYEQQDFINSITNGDYGDPRKWTHVLGGFDRFFQGGSINPTEKLAGNVSFSAGGSYWFSPGDKVIIVDPHSKRFMQFCNAIDERQHLGVEQNLHDISTDDRAREAIDDYTASAYGDKEEGIRAWFLEDETVRPSWASIADWIVDLEAKKLYKISEI